jgi:hypothetical protein
MPTVRHDLRVLGVAAGLAVVPTAAGGCSFGGSDAATAPSRDPPNAPLRGCRERVEAGPPAKPRPRRDTIVGPLVLQGAASAWRRASRQPPSGNYPPGFNASPMKIIAMLRAGERATLVVPKAQRDWMRLLYRVPFGRGDTAIALQACRRSTSEADQRRECGPRPRHACRSPYTYFNGGIYIDFAAAPERGRCAQIEVWTRRRTRPLVARLFERDPVACRANKSR